MGAVHGAGDGGGAEEVTQIIDLDVSTGPSLRMAFLMTHYRQPMEIGEARRKEAAKILRRFALACEPCLDGPPLEVAETLANDLNTPGVIAILHGYRARKEGRKLFASLRFLGFFGNTCLPDEVKTLPPDHEWSQPQYVQLDPMGRA